MLRSIIVLIFFLLVCTEGCTQSQAEKSITVKGKIVDRLTNLPLSYASIGIPDKPFGTLSDSLGNFMFTIAEQNLSDTVRISIIGYQTAELPLKDLHIQEMVIQLSPKFTELTEVVITPANDSTAVFGRKNTSKLLQISIHLKNSVQETIGSELGMRYKIRPEHAYLRDFNFYLSANSFNYIKLRINVYNVKNNTPDTLICNRQIFVKLDNYKTGWTSVDLRGEHISLPSDFIVTMQWVESRMEKTGKFITLVPVALSSSKNCYARVASQDRWKRMGVGLSNYITIGY